MTKDIIQFINGEIYHICYRAVGDSVVFKDEDDYFRGIFSIYELNTTKLIEIREQRRKRKMIKSYGSPTPVSFVDSRDMFVEVLAFCFMPNHIHLVVRQLKENGISQFMQKMGGGYANYSNKKHQRKGHLFNRFKAFHITSDSQLKNTITYVHCNPISLIEPGWKEKGIKNPDEVIKFLENQYRWSSYWDYIGKKNFSSVTYRDFVLDIMGGKQGCRQAVRDWIKYNGEIKGFDDNILEK